MYTKTRFGTLQPHMAVREQYSKMRVHYQPYKHTNPSNTDLRPTDVGSFMVPYKQKSIEVAEHPYLVARVILTL